MAIQILTSIASGLAGVVIGAITTWNKDRIAARQHIMDFLLRMRQELDSKPELLEVVDLLKNELDARLKNGPVPKTDTNGQQLRDLPSFLEPIGTFLEYNPSSFRKAYGFFSEEVLLCAESTLLWADDVRYDQSVYWRSFTKFVERTRKSGYRL